MPKPDSSLDETGIGTLNASGREHAEESECVGQLLEIMVRLRDPDSGCPWDIEQTFQSIAPYTIEEAYEVADAIERGDIPGLKGELGDLLLQVVYHSRIAEELGHFTFRDVVLSVCEKMIRRHPHVFGTENRDKSALDQVRDWEIAKAAERASGGTDDARVLAGVAVGLAALTRATKLQDRASRVGFDWPDASHVLGKLSEEAAELIDAQGTSSARAAEEFGDLLFSLVGLARHLGIDPESALRSANSKFVRRFEAIESRMSSSGRSLEGATLEELDAAWNEVKSEESLKNPFT